ncbi:hypothetical protein Patl1_23207 [Pistacia atlantica]|uniref:Uncharacterized protein n=1 Tax=Pistacia atlantica TaxID=434234 RepID=A0ACC0ZZR4_9ROSI|nr:hypothetical protein Patl1_23207 [Pistacia atlantica]
MMKEVHSEKNNVIAVGVDDKPLSCFGCGIGWFSFLLGFVFPPLWYYATVLYLGKYYLKDPRERSGLAASAIAVSRFFSFLGFDLLCCALGSSSCCVLVAKFSVPSSSILVQP